MPQGWQQLSTESDGGTPRNSMDSEKRPSIDSLDSLDEDLSREPKPDSQSGKVPGPSGRQQTDPFFIVQSEVRGTVKVAEELLSRWRQMNPETDNDFDLNTREICSYVKSAKESLKSLEDGLKIIRTHRRKFRLSEEEITARGHFIIETRQTLDSMTDELSSSTRESIYASGGSEHSGEPHRSP